MKIKTNTANLLGVHFDKPNQGFCNKFSDIANRILLIEGLKGQILKKSDNEMILMADEFCLNFFPTGVVMTSPVFFHESLTKYVFDEKSQNFYFFNFYNPLFSNRAPIILNGDKYKKYTNLFFVTASMIFNQIAHSTMDLGAQVSLAGCVQYHYIKSVDRIVWPFYDNYFKKNNPAGWTESSSVIKRRFENEKDQITTEIEIISPEKSPLIDYGMVLDYQNKTGISDTGSSKSFYNVCCNIELLEKDSESAFEALSVFDYSSSFEIDKPSPSKLIH